MEKKEIFSELLAIRNNTDNGIYLSKWKLKYLDKYIIFGNVSEVNHKIEVESGKYIDLDGLYGDFLLSEEGEYFISKYDNSKSAKLNSYLGKYPNISKLFYVLLGIVIGLIPTVIIFLNNLLGKN